MRAGISAPVTCGGAYVIDGSGREHHFGGARLKLVGHGRYLHTEYVTSYRDAETEAEFDYGVCMGEIEAPASVSIRAAKGPLLSARAILALNGMARSCNQNNGVAQDFEKREIVLTALALQRAGHALPRSEVECWTATHGWSIDHAREIAALVDRAIRGTKFRPPIKLDDEMFDRFVASWNDASRRAA